MMHGNNLRSLVRRGLQFIGATDGSLNRKVIRSGIWVSFATLSSVALNLVKGICLARLLNPEVFGLMSICSIVIRGLEIFSETGFGAALVHQKKENFEKARDTAFTLMVCRGLLLTGIAFFLASPIANFYDNPILNSLISAISIIFLLNSFQNMNSILLQRELNFKPLVIVEVITNFVGFLVSISLAYIMRNVWALVLAQLITSGIGTVMSFVLVPGRPRFAFVPEIARDLFNYGKFISGLSMVIFVTVEIDKAVIGKLIGMEALGFYTIAYTIANIPSTYISKIVSKVLFPVYSMLRDNPAALRSELGKAIHIVSMMAIPIAVITGVLSKDILRICYGEKWIPASGVLSVLSVFGCCRALGSLNGYLYNGIGKPNIPFYLNLAKLIAICIFIYPLTKYFGVIGAATTIVIPSICQYLVGVFLLKRIIGLPLSISVRPVLITLAQSGVMLFVIFFAKSIIEVDSFGKLFFLLSVSGIVIILLNLQRFKLAITHLKIA